MAPSQQRWGRVEELFHQALEQPPDSRDLWLDQTCAGDAELRAEVASLLASDSAAREGFVGAKVQDAFQNLVAEEGTKTPMEGRRIGSWQLVREIGRGGMGAVYLAVRADQQYESKVAIKLVRPDFYTDFTLRRFRRERQILARLDHPNITRLFDGGTTEEGIPYLVMEFIEGTPITRYATEHQLSLDERIRLCQPVCSAVEYAHRNLIVHRDLKPANILIDANGLPKLLDFGISKLLESDGQEPGNTQGIALLTPEYASPEQILGEPVTIASDVYSLGAVMYELFTGVRPHKVERATTLERQRAICQEPAATPSKVALDPAVARRLKGDLDNILLRAMQKEPGRRYLSVEHLSEDLRRYLEHRPVVARPDSPFYRASKFVRRNRVVVALAALAAVAVLAGAVISLREAQIANERFQDVRKLATTFVFDVEEAARDLPGSTHVRQLITRTGVEYLNNLARASAGDWGLKRELAGAYLRIGRVQGGTSTGNLGDSKGAMASFVSAGKLLDEAIQHAPAGRQLILDRADVYLEIGSLEAETQQAQDGEQSARAGLRLARSLLDRDPKDPQAVQYAGLFHQELSQVEQIHANFDAAHSDATAAVRLLEQYAAAKPDDRNAQMDFAGSLQELGSLLLKTAHTEEALENFRRATAVLDAVALKHPNDTAVRHASMLAYSHLSDTLGNPEYQNAGDPPGAYRAGQKMVEAAKFLYDADPADVQAISDYGIALLRLGLITPKVPEKHRTFELSEDLLTKAISLNPRSRAVASHKTWVESELAALCAANGERAAGVRYYQMAIATAEQSLSSDPNYSSALKGLMVAVRGLGDIQAREGARAEALATLDHGLRTGRRLEASSAPTATILRANVARAWQAAGSVYTILSAREQDNQALEDGDAARVWYRRALDEWHRLEPQKGFVAPYRREMEAATQALAELERAKPKAPPHN